MIRKTIRATWRFYLSLCSLFVSTLLRSTGVRIGRDVQFTGMPFVWRGVNSRIVIEDQVKIDSSFWSNPGGLNHRTILFTKPGAEIRIGHGSGLSGATLYAATGIHIGSNVLIGVNAAIYDTDFHAIDPKSRRREQEDVPLSRAVVVEDDVFIGANAIILKGVRIGCGAVIGAASVVTKDVPPYTVAAGNPARVVKSLQDDRE